MAARGLDDDEGTAVEVLAADPAHDRIHTPAPTAPERAQESWRLPSKRLPSERGHGQHTMARDAALWQQLAHRAAPRIPVDFGAS
jgi:hypothetical protein